MGKKIIFLDVDGTLCSYDFNRGEYVPESAVAAIHKARANGHLVFLSTGRSLSEISPQIHSIGFDGVVGGAGSFIQYRGEILFKKTFSRQQVEEVSSYLAQAGIAYHLECNSGLYASDNMAQVIKIAMPFVDMKKDPYFMRQQPEFLCNREDVNKISFTSVTRNYDEIYADLSSRYHLVKASWGPEISGVWGGEISLPGVNKGSAIRWLLDYLKICPQDSFAFGDSMNDLEMFQVVDTAIAMGNSRHGVEAYAQYQTTDLDHGGIYNGMSHFGLI